MHIEWALIGLTVTVQLLRTQITAGGYIRSSMLACTKILSPLSPSNEIYLLNTYLVFLPQQA